ncbi:MAG: sodium/proline symporter, partial [Bacteroidales bacterium]|nr:sodium/proline symporter [Bacteroidales bacterium]
MDIKIIIPFIAYFILIIGIGIYSAKFSSKGLSEFFLGGRQMNRFVVALSAVVSGRSAWLLIGFTGMVYIMGFSAIWAVVGYIIVEFFLFLYYAPRIRNYTEKHNCITLPDFYASRFNDKNNSLRILIVVIFLVFMLMYVAAQFVAGGKAFYANFEISQNTGLLITAAIILIYTLLGGFLAVSLTDVVQAIFMIIALIGLPLYGIVYKGGWDVITMELNQIDSNFLNPFNISIGVLIGFIGIGLGSPGSPHIIVRYMSMKDPKQFRWTAIVGTVWNIILAGGAFYIGLVGRAFYPEISMLPGEDSENIYIALSNDLLNPVLVGLLLASIFAAIMSTADSQLLVAASSIVRDIYDKILHKDENLSQKKLTNLSRITVTILVIIAVLLGMWVQDLVFWFVLFAWAGLGASIGPTSILALFWKKTTKLGVFTGLLTGAVCVFVWRLVGCLNSLIYELIPAFFLALLVTVFVSLLDKNIKN